MLWNSVITSLLEKRPGKKSLLLEDFFKEPPPGYQGDKPLLAIVGPTGSGKSTLLNMLLGFPVLEEGLDTTTRRPTVIQWAQEWQLQAIGKEEHLITLSHEDLSLYLQPVSLEEAENHLVSRLYFDDEDAEMQEVFQRIRFIRANFWSKIQYSGSHEMIYTVLEGPFPLLTRECLIVDIPGFEEGISQKPTPLEVLIRSWLQKCDATLFVIGKGKTRLGGISSWIRHQLDRNIPCALYISQMDTFDASQFGGGKEGIANFYNSLVKSYQDQQIPVPEEMPMFFGCARLIPGRGFNGTINSLPVAQREAVKRLESSLLGLN
ncbi:MAG: ATP-binding cassette domain-containing protein [Cyanobacteria bacterium CRU_2_1]|nr:ATP-binding cassette domain-containing protein [Cyanobacteria bacterium CRU_2_1]